MRSFSFWSMWLLIVSIYIAVFGLVLAFFNQSQLMDFIFNRQINPVFWPGAGIPEKAALFQAWIYGVLGATVLGWGILMAFLVYYPFKAREKWAWNSLAVSITVWFIADTTISSFYSATFNVVFNTILLLLVVVPLLFTRKYFYHTPKTLPDSQEGNKPA